MFKTARMRKIRIVTLEKYVAPTVDALHESGLIQISDISDSIQQDPELAELVAPAKASPYTGKLSSLLMKTNGISELLGNSLSEVKVYALTSGRESQKAHPPGAGCQEGKGVV